MSVYIDRDRLENFAMNCVGGMVNMKQIHDFPAADVVKRKRGKWIDDRVAFYRGCSECGCYLEYAVDTFLDYGDHYNFCPSCGAEMRGG